MPQMSVVYQKTSEREEAISIVGVWSESGDLKHLAVLILLTTRSETGHRFRAKNIIQKTIPHLFQRRLGLGRWTESGSG